MKRLMSILLMVSCLSSLSFAVSNTLINRTSVPLDPCGVRAPQVQTTRNAKELTTGCSTYVLTLTSATVTTIASNVNRERIRIYNMDASNLVYVMEASSWGTAPTAAKVLANGVTIAVSSASTGLVGTNIFTEDIYNGTICLLGAVEAGVSIRVVEYFKQ